MSAVQLWCPKCEEYTALVDRGVCPWCDTPLERRARRGGWKRPDLKAKLSDDQLRALHRAHAHHGLSINALAKRIYARVGYASHGSAATAISKGWQRLGLPARGRIEQTVLSSTKHGRKRRNQSSEEQTAYRRWLAEQRGWHALQGPGRPPCKGVRRNHPRKGKPCERHALEGSDYCYAHDPQRELERQAHTAKMRRRQPKPTMLPAGPFIAWLNELHDRHGAWRLVGELVGMGTTQAHKWGRGRATGGGPLDQVSLAVIERSAERAGTTVEVIYGNVAERAA